MCGIAGYFSLRSDVQENVLRNMAESLLHRGPDHQGIWIANDAKTGFAHTRLSILDTSSAGHQPMPSFSGRFMICFNGEIYNHQEMRKKLADSGHSISYKSQSDTETILSCFEIWGIKKTIEETVGMFAFAVVDYKENKLVLGRDRFGEKPLYYGWQDQYFYFASELKAIRKHPSFQPEMDHDALHQYMQYAYIPAPLSIYKGIHKLNPGNLLSISLNETAGNMRMESYWDLSEVAANAQQMQFSGSDTDALNELERILAQSVKGQQLSDVPLGAFLSGGIDSSLIVALMQAQSSRPVNTFTIGFKEDVYNEAKFASKVASHLGTNHNEFYLGANDVMDVIPSLPQLYDEPFADSSQLPTFLVSQLARKHVTVSLSGDAGDEIFGGYNRYMQAGRFNKYPRFLRKAIASSVLKFSPTQLNQAYQLFKPILPGSLKSSNPGNHLVKIAGILSLESNWEIYQKLVSIGSSSDILLDKSNFRSSNKERFDFLPDHTEFAHRMMLTDSLSYLPDDILCKVDRAAMGVSLETRVPFLDHRVAAFAWTLPLNMKIRHGKGKWLLRELLYKYVPQHLIERPKMGFGLPIDSWLRGPLKDWAESLLNEKDLKELGYMNAGYVRTMWNDHLSGRKNLQYELWNILIFRDWQKHWL
jgi:asparagine synthase (glutamine-hydrolysing)